MEIVRRTGVTSGYCLDIGCGDGRLALALARRTDLKIYAVEWDDKRMAVARRMLDEAGLHGTRVTVHRFDLTRIPYADYFADLVVSGRSVDEGPEAVPTAAYERMQRPYGGRACFGRPGAMTESTRGALPGAGSWTHQNTDPSNTLCSEDTRVSAPLAMLWFRDTDFVMPSRRGRGPAPLVDDRRYTNEALRAEARQRAAGDANLEKRLYRELLPRQPFGRLVALDAATGKCLWQNEEEVFGTQLAVSEKYGLVLMCCQPGHQASLHSELGNRMAAISTADGKRVWDIQAEYVARPILNDHTIYAEPGAWDLLSGHRAPFSLERSYGCGIPAGSRNLLVFRSATLGYIDLTKGDATENYGGIRPGCWLNVIPAGGLVLMADAASWCTCSYLNQATIALKPGTVEPYPGRTTPRQAKTTKLLEKRPGG